jgi:hypothetical protein
LLARPSVMTTGSDCPESAIIEVSSGNAANPGRKVTGTVREFIRKRLTLVTGEEIAVSAAIRVQSRDLLFLGEVLSCVSNPKAQWTVQVRVKTSLLVV